jgi:hypothetical protein
VQRTRRASGGVHPTVPSEGKAFTDAVRHTRFPARHKRQKALRARNERLLYNVIGNSGAANTPQSARAHATGSDAATPTQHSNVPRALRSVGDVGSHGVERQLYRLQVDIQLNRRALKEVRDAVAVQSHKILRWGHWCSRRQPHRQCHRCPAAATQQHETAIHAFTIVSARSNSRKRQRRQLCRTCTRRPYFCRLTLAPDPWGAGLSSLPPLLRWLRVFVSSGLIITVVVMVAVAMGSSVSPPSPRAHTALGMMDACSATVRMVATPCSHAMPLHHVRLLFHPST